MAVAKNNAIEHLIKHIKTAMANGKFADIDSSLNSSSINPVQNRVVTAKFNELEARIQNVSGWVYAGALAYENGSTDIVTIDDIEDVENLLILTVSPVLNEMNTMWVVSKHNTSNFASVKMSGTSGGGANIDVDGGSNYVQIGFDNPPVTGAEYTIPVFYQILSKTEGE